MPVVNPLSRELVFKIVYYGPGLGGKTTTLQHIHATTKAEHRGKMVSLATPVDRTLYFDFLPIRLPTARGMGVRLQLFTVPGQVYYNATRRLVLTGADGIVFVADSQRARLDANLESLANLNDNLREHGRQLQDVPHAIAYNKRDLYDVVSIEELERQLDRHGAPSFATCATQGEGVYETLDAIARAVLDDFERRNPEGHEVVARELEVPEGGLTAALRGVDKAASVVEAAAPRAAFDRPSDELPSAAGEDAARALPPQRASRVAPAPIQPPSASEPTRVEAVHEVAEALEPSAPVAPVAPARDASFEPSIQEDTRQRGGASFQVLWPEQEQASVSELELALSEGRYADAVKLADELVSRALAGVGGTLGAAGEAPRDPALVATLLGLDGRGYLAFRALVREARSSQDVSEVGALSAFAFAIDVRLARSRIG